MSLFCLKSLRHVCALHFEVQQVKWQTAMHKIKPQRQNQKDRSTLLLWKVFVSKKVNRFISVLSPSEKEHENYNAWIMKDSNR